MEYRLDKYGNQLSVLGFGCMRFPRTVGRTDLEETEREILYAVEQGVNYFDTAYIYPGSEAALGEILEKNDLRRRVFLATKLPHYLIKSIGDAERIFQEELRRLRTDHVDYYLMHMLSDVQSWQRLCELGMVQWLEEKKAIGQIRQVGFPTTATVRCSAVWWTPMIGTSARSSITTWTSTPRPAAGVCTTPMKRDFRW